MSGMLPTRSSDTRRVTSPGAYCEGNARTTGSSPAAVMRHRWSPRESATGGLGSHPEAPPCGVRRAVQLHLDGRAGRRRLHGDQPRHLGKELLELWIRGEHRLHLLGQRHRLRVLVEIHELRHSRQGDVACPAHLRFPTGVERAKDDDGREREHAGGDQPCTPHRMSSRGEQGFPDLGRAAEAALGLTGQTAEDDLAPSPIQARKHNVRRDWRLVDSPGRGGQRGVPGERELPGHHLVHHDPERVEIRGWSDGAAGHLFRCHVLRRADHPAAPVSAGSVPLSSGRAMPKSVITARVELEFLRAPALDQEELLLLKSR